MRVPIVKTLAIGFALTLVSCASSAPSARDAAGDEGIRRTCERDKLECRRNVRIVLRRDDGTTYDKTFDWYWPKLQGDPAWLTVLPGETIHLEMDVDGNVLTPRRIVSDPRTPEKTVTFRFKQEDKIGMLLTVENPFPKPLKYDLFMLLVEDRERKPRATSSCPVLPKLSVYEQWPNAIYTLVAANFRFVEGADSTKCSIDSRTPPAVGPPVN